jgi:purine-nucleoside phosphorylase
VTAFPGPGDDHAERGAALVRARAGGLEPRVAVVLGSGLGDAVQEDLDVRAELAFDELPGFPPAAVPGHAGRLVLGELYGVPVLVQFGRVHLYEGHPMSTVTLPTRLLGHLGVRTLVLTNAAGGLDPEMPLGLLVLIRDHINFMGTNALAGWRFPDGMPAFVDVSGVWDASLRAVVAEVAAAEGIEVREGVYAAVAGPSYETAAETTFLARLGADAVGMSTVPEAVAAAAFGMRCLGISCVTDVAGTELTHQEVVAVASEAAPNLRRLLSGAIPKMGEPWTAT